MSLISSDLLLELYGAAQAPERWTGFLDRVCKDLGVVNAAVQGLALRGDRLDETWCVRDTRSEQLRDLHDRLVNNPANPRFNLAIDQTRFDQKIVRDSDRFAQGCPHFSTFRENLKAAGLGESICLSVAARSNHVYAMILHNGSEAGGNFDARVDAYLHELSPHLEQALKLGPGTDTQSDELPALRRVLDGLRIGIAISRDGLSLDWANAAAKDVLRRSPHLINLSGRGGFTRFRTGQDISQLTILAAGEDHELQVLAMKLGGPMAEYGGDEPAGLALLLVEPRRAPDLAPEELARVLGVTRGEGRIAAWLAGGGTLKDFAIYRGISEGSVRNQAKQTLAKAGVPRQADLVRHICSSIPGLLRSSIDQLGQ